MRLAIRPLFRALLIALPFLFLGELVAVAFVVDAGPPYHPRHGFVTILAGEGHRPFVNRALLPSAARLLSGGVPAQEIRREDLAPKRPVPRLLRRLWDVRPEHLRGATVLVSLMGFAYAGYGYFVYRLAQDLGEMGPPGALLVGGFAMLIPAVWSIREAQHTYDAGTLCFAAALTYFGLRARPLTFWPLYVGALFAKESLAVLALVIIVPHLIHRAWVPAMRDILLAAAAVGVSRAMVHYWFGDYPGADVQFGMVDEPSHRYWLENLRVLTFLDARSVRTWLKVAVVAVPAVLGLRYASRTFRSTVYTTSLAAIVPLFFVGRFMETRVFFDLVPLWIAAAFPLWLGWLRTAPRVGSADPLSTLASEGA